MTPIQVEALEHARREALLSADVAKLDELLDDELCWVHSSAAVDSKSSLLGGLSSGRLRCLALAFPEQNLEVRGHVAILTGVVDMSVEIGGVPRQGLSRYVAIWSEGANGVRMIHWQTTRLPDA